MAETISEVIEKLIAVKIFLEVHGEHLKMSSPEMHKKLIVKVKEHKKKLDKLLPPSDEGA